jgi:lipopolysaccharide transport system ATP-binding protein
LTSSMTPLVRVEHVSKKYCKSLKRSLWYGLRDLAGELAGNRGEGRLRLRKDEFLAIDDVSFELRRGECLGLIGANGAGKSTLLKMLNGLVRPDAGRIEIRGRVGALIELGAGFNPILTGRENVYVNGAVLGLSKKEIDTRFDEIVAFAEIAAFIDSPVQSYSSGMRVRLGFAVAAHLEPDVLLIDEVLAVGDSLFRARCISRMAALAKRTAMIFVSHQLPLVARVADRSLVLEHGKVRLSGPGHSDAFEALFSALPWPRRETTGTGVLRLLDFEVRAGALSSREAELVLESDFELVLELRFSATRPLPHCVVNVVLLDIEERVVLRCESNGTDVPLEGRQGEFTVTVTVPPLPLSAGRYLVSAHVAEQRAGGLPGELLAVERNLGRLEVRTARHSFGLLQPEGQWTMHARSE